MTRLMILGGAVALSACATVGEEPQFGVCRVEKLGQFHGREVTTEVESEALRLSGARTLRRIRPGDAVTMDFRQDRLNADLDAGGRISGFRCG